MSNAESKIKLFVLLCLHVFQLQPLWHFIKILKNLHLIFAVQCRVRKMGLDLYVDIHVGVAATLTVAQGHHIAHLVKDAIRATHPAVADALVHIEPVYTDATPSA